MKWEGCYENIYTTDFYQRNYNPYGFNDKTQEICYLTRNAEWRNVYQGWEPARWVKSTYRGTTLEWKSLDPVDYLTDGTWLDIDRLFYVFSVTSANWLVTKDPHPLAIAVRSEALCKLKPIQQMLEVAVCDCSAQPG